MVKETVAQRNMRVAQEQREAELKWEAEKPVRLLNALAMARSLDIDAHVFYRHDDILYYYFSFSDGENVYCDPVVELGEWTMRTIEADLEATKMKKQRDSHLNRVRDELLARLSDEEKEALGLL